MIKILIAEHNLSKNIILSNYLSQQTEFKIIYQATTEQETYQQYIQHKPDVLLLNFSILSKNNNLITQLQSNKTLSNKSNIILYYTNKTNCILGNLNNIYSIYHSADNLNLFANDILNIYKQNQKTDYRAFITDILIKLGFTLSNYGTQFIIDAIIYIYENNLKTFSIKNIYNELSSIHSVSPKKIQWNIESAINSMWHYCSINIRSIFNNYDDERKLSPKYLITLILDILPRTLL